MGPSIYEVRKILGFFDPLPPCPHLGLIYSTKFTNLPYYIFFWANPPPPHSADIIYGCPICTHALLLNEKCVRRNVFARLYILKVHSSHVGKELLVR